MSVSVEIPDDISEYGLDLSISARNREGLDIIVFSASENGIKLCPGKRQKIEFKFTNYLIGGRYTLSVSLENRNTVPVEYYDYLEGAAVIETEKGDNLYGIFHTDAEVYIIE